MFEAVSEKEELRKHAITSLFYICESKEIEANLLVRFYGLNTAWLRWEFCENGTKKCRRRSIDKNRRECLKLYINNLMR